MSDNKRQPPVVLNMEFDEALRRFVQTSPEETKQVASEKGSPLPLTEDAETGDRFLIYASEGGVEVNLQVEGDTFWASQAQMAEIFGVTRQNVSLHLANIFKEGELVEATTCKESLRVGQTGQPYRFKVYDLNALISVGYRVGGRLGTMFRIWATDRLVRYLANGFVVDVKRLKEPGNYDRVTELREIIRDIRAAEANVYAELRRICSLCRDYDPKSESARSFYSRMQANLYWAVVSHTPSEILVTRANAEVPNMGLRTWSKADVLQADVVTAKNYLADSELRELNRLTTILLDIFDDQLNIGRLTLMSEATALLDAQLKSLNRAVLNSGGRVSAATAEAHVKSEYHKFDNRRREMRAEVYAKEVATLKAAGASLPTAKPRKGKS